MIRRRRPSREILQRRKRLTDNHKNRQHWHKMWVNAGYTPWLNRIDPDRCKHWVYILSSGPIHLGNLAATPLYSTLLDGVD